MWCTAPGSDPATKPRARAVIHKARWDREAGLRFGGSATGLRGENCVLQPPNIFPEWPVEASDQGGTSVSLYSPILLWQISLCPERPSHRSKEKEGGKKQKGGHHTKCRLWDIKKRLLAVLHLVRKSVAAPREVKRYCKSSYKNNQKHSLKKLGQPQTEMEKSQLDPIPWVPLFSLFLPHKIRNIFPLKTYYSKKCNCQERRKPTSEETDSTCAKWISSGKEESNSEFPSFCSSSGLRGCPEEWDHS